MIIFRVILTALLLIPGIGHASGVGYCSEACQINGSDIVVIGVVTEIVEREETTNTYKIAVQKVLKGKIPSSEILVKAYSIPDNQIDRNEQSGMIEHRSGPMWISHVFGEGDRVGLMLERRATSTEEYSDVYILNNAQGNTDPEKVLSEFRRSSYQRYGLLLFVLSAIASIGSLVSLIISVIGRRKQPQSLRWKKALRVSRMILILGLAGLATWFIWALSIRLV